VLSSLESLPLRPLLFFDLLFLFAPLALSWLSALSPHIIRREEGEPPPPSDCISVALPKCNY
jgi:hypothetical protein